MNYLFLTLIVGCQLYSVQEMQLYYEDILPKEIWREILGYCSVKKWFMHMLYRKQPNGSQIIPIDEELANKIAGNLIKKLDIVHDSYSGYWKKQKRKKQKLNNKNIVSMEFKATYRAIKKKKPAYFEDIILSRSELEKSITWQFNSLKVIGNSLPAQGKQHIMHALKKKMCITDNVFYLFAKPYLTDHEKIMFLVKEPMTLRESLSLYLLYKHSQKKRESSIINVADYQNLLIEYLPCLQQVNPMELS